MSIERAQPHMRLALLCLAFTALALWFGSVTEITAVQPTHANSQPPASIDAVVNSTRETTSTTKPNTTAARGNDTAADRSDPLLGDSSDDSRTDTQYRGRPDLSYRLTPSPHAQTQQTNSTPFDPTGASASRNIPSKACPVLHPVDHGLENTGRKALVLYTVTSLADKQARQVEMDNLRFFKEHGMFPPNAPTALFSAIDFAFLTINLNRPVNSRAKSDHGVLECDGGGSSNVRVFEAPSGPCDLCAEARLINAFGGPDQVARSYEFIAVLNSGVRGPFFSEAPAAPGNKSPVTWIDHMALGGEKVYTGAIMTASNGASDRKRPFLFSFAFNFPASLLPVLHPVLLAGCNEAPLSPLWRVWNYAYELNFHDPALDTLTVPQLREVLNRTLNNVSAITSVPEGKRSPEEKRFDRRVAHGVKYRVRMTKIVDNYLLRKGGWRARLGDRKFRCVFRAEMQLLKSALEARLPPEAEPTPEATPARENATRKTLRRPRLTAAQNALLSPALSGYLHEGHFFARTWKQNQTMVNMGHASVALYRTAAELKNSSEFNVSPCAVIITKFGGGGWRAKQFPHSVIEEVQELSLLHVPRFHASSTTNLANAVRCRNPRFIQPTNEKK